MKIYFLSSEPCSLTLNGVFYGVTDRFERSAELSLSDNLYAEFSPQGALPRGVFLTPALLTDPPEGFEVYKIKEGLALYACDFPPADFTLRPVAQAREGERLATLFRQGKLQLALESPQGFFTASVPPAFEPCALAFHGEVLLLKGERHLAVYSQQGERLFFEEVTAYECTDGELSVTLPLSDSLSRTAKCRYALSGEGCTLLEFTLCEPENSPAPREGLFAFAFFESLLLRADYQSLLCDGLQAEADRIVDFLGEFVAVTLTPEPTVCGLVKKRKERLFEVEYYAVTVEKGKITDVRG